MCFITTANRRRCQRCRYNRCLKAGMKPESVLTDDQKKIRFRKVNLKKSMLKVRGNGTQESFCREDFSERNQNSSDEEDDDEENKPEDFLDKDLEDQKPDLQSSEKKLLSQLSKPPEIDFNNYSLVFQNRTPTYNGEAGIWKGSQTQNLNHISQNMRQYFNGSLDQTTNYHHPSFHTYQHTFSGLNFCNQDQDFLQHPVMQPPSCHNSNTTPSIHTENRVMPINTSDAYHQRTISKPQHNKFTYSQVWLSSLY